jgi:hypothetical protein
MPPPQAGNGSAYCEVGQFAHDGGMRLRSSSNDVNPARGGESLGHSDALIRRTF